MMISFLLFVLSIIVISVIKPEVGYVILLAILMIVGNPFVLLGIVILHSFIKASNGTH